VNWLDALGWALLIVMAVCGVAAATALWLSYRSGRP
jgi:hypothetical protein